MITIIDYGMGNLRSVQKGFESQGIEARISSKPAEIGESEKVVLPGVGAFRDAIHELKRQGLVNSIKDHIGQEKPFLGICLGLQMLFDVSYEDGEFEGLGILPGKVVRFEETPGFKIPHMGWNQLESTGEHPLLKGIPKSSYFYFVHSYYVVPEDETVVTTRTNYIQPFVSMISRGNLSATQFHPEKSQSVGLQLLRNFATL